MEGGEPRARCDACGHDLEQAIPVIYDCFHALHVACAYYGNGSEACPLCRAPFADAGQTSSARPALCDVCGGELDPREIAFVSPDCNHALHLGCSYSMGGACPCCPAPDTPPMSPYTSLGDGFGSPGLSRTPTYSHGDLFDETPPATHSPYSPQQPAASYTGQQPPAPVNTFCSHARQPPPAAPHSFFASPQPARARQRLRCPTSSQPSQDVLLPPPPPPAAPHSFFASPQPAQARQRLRCPTSSQQSQDVLFQQMPPLPPQVSENPYHFNFPRVGPPPPPVAPRSFFASPQPTPTRQQLGCPPSSQPTQDVLFQQMPPPPQASNFPRVGPLPPSHPFQASAFEHHQQQQQPPAPAWFEHAPLPAREYLPTACAFCGGDMFRGQTAVTSQCYHRFHFRCFAGTFCCPVCRVQWSDVAGPALILPPFDLSLLRAKPLF